MSEKEVLCLDSNSVVKLWVISKPEEFRSRPPELSFAPTYTHQVFPNEKIVGYKDLQVNLFFTSHSLYLYVEIKFAEKSEHATDINACLARWVVGGSCADENEFLRRLEEPFTPPSPIIADYEIGDQKFVVRRGTLATDPQLKAFHQRLQLFLVFYIEASSYIDAEDPVWEVLSIWQQPDSPADRELIVGYTTLYTFFAFPDSSRVRLSQILILPCYQRKGHGQRLLQIVYELAARGPFLEVNVEDPSPGFQSVRDIVDLSRCRSAGFFCGEG